MPDPQEQHREARIRYRCNCGARLAIAARLLGQVRQCPRCGGEFTVSLTAESVAQPAPQSQELSVPVSLELRSTATAADLLRTGDATCAVCQCLISPEEECTECSACGLPHHTDCWQENLGCSAYGCAQVNALKIGPDIQIGSRLLETMIQGPGSLSPRVVPALKAAAAPWEYAILCMSVLCFLIGVVTYGIPCFLTLAVIAGFVLVREGRVNWIALVPAGLICVFGVFIGMMSSSHIYTH